MVMAQVDGRIIASHLPLHNSIHAHQVIVELDVPSNTQTQIHSLLASDSLVTLQPERFSLNQFRKGNLKKFNANVFDGHFERGGARKIDNLTFNVVRILLDKHIHDGPNNQFILLPVTSKAGVLVHAIGELPSFDQILAVSLSEELKEAKTISNRNDLPLTRSNQFRLLKEHNLEFRKQLFLEFDDFVAR